MAHHTITENGNTVNCYEYSIKTEDEYKVVLSAIDKLMDVDPPAGSIPGDILLWLSFSAQEFESKQMRGKGPWVTCKDCGNQYSRPDWCDNCGSVKPDVKTKSIVADMTIIPKHLPYPILPPNAKMTGPKAPVH